MKRLHMAAAVMNQTPLDWKPNAEHIRQAIAAAGIKDADVVIYDQPKLNQVLVSLPEQHDESSLDAGREQIEAALKDHYDSTISARNILNVQVVGPTVGRQLEKKAALATLYSLAGMLIYLWFRFQLIYGVAAVVACFHDTLITVGAHRPGDQPHGHRRHPHAGRIFHERHDRGF